MNFLDKDFSSVQDVCMSKETTLKELKETVRTKTQQTENINHAMKFVKSDQIEIVKLKSTPPKKGLIMDKVSMTKLNSRRNN